MQFRIFEDRVEAGRRLAEALESYRDVNGLVLALPRGGVVIGHELARELGLPLDVIIVRKLGAPDNPELGIGALAEVGEPQLDWALVRALGVDQSYVDSEIQHQREEIERRRALYRNGRPAPSLAGRVPIVVDDGAATGYTMLAGLRALASARPARRVAGLPVCPPDVVHLLRTEADHVACLATPDPFGAVGIWYRDFEQVDDDEVCRLLEQAQNTAGRTRREGQ